MTLVLSTLPLFSCEGSCPLACQCSPSGNVKCSGYTITDTPERLPVHTYTLMLNGTSMRAINERSLADQDLLLRFSLTYSHLHTIHPQAFHVAPQLRSIKLSSNDLSHLPAHVFSPLTSLEEIYLDSNQLETLSADMFVGLDKLMVLDLTRNRLTNLTSDIFDQLTNLTTLNLGRNCIKKLPPTIFQSLTNLCRLRIYNNELEALEAGIFDGLVNLEELSLHQNKIGRLAPQVFWSLNNLRTLTMSSNQLQAVPPKSFYNLYKLSKLTIYKNPLLFLPDELMGHMPYITEFYLFTTNLTTVPRNLFTNMSGLLHLNLHLNDKLRELPSDLFCCLPYLQKLSLRQNNLSHLHPQLFSTLPTLAVLLLNGNNISSLNANIFQNLTGLVTLELTNNNLKSLPGDIFLTNTALNSLTLSGNLWDCNCAIRGIAEWIRRNEHVVRDSADAMCHSPLNHLLRTLSSLHDEEFGNCDPKRVTSYSPIQTDLYEPTIPLHATSTSSLSELTASDATTASPSPSITASSKLTESGIISHHFYETIVVEEVPVYVHHNQHKGWLYVWFLPSNTDEVGFLMFCYILLLCTGLLLILAAIFGMHRLSVTMNKLKNECVNNKE